MSPCFSVVIPVYNAGKYIIACLDSIDAARKLLPADCEVEVICVDDGSTDETAGLLDEYSLRNPWCRIIHQENHGVSIARNTGLGHVKGEWVSFVDSDDLVDEEYFTCFLAQSEKADINFFAHTRTLASGERKTNALESSVFISSYDEVPPLVSELIYNKTGENLFGYTWNKFIRSSIVKEKGILFPNEEHYLEYEDEIFTFEVCHFAASVSYVPKVLYYYRIGSNNSYSHRVPQYLMRSKYEIAIGDKDARFGFKCAAYMSAGMALLMQAYSSVSPKDAFRTARYLKEHQQYMIPVVVKENRLSALAKLPGAVLFMYLWVHGCGSVVKGVVRKALSR